MSFQQPTQNRPLHEILPLLDPAEAAFFTLLDAELDKVERFYLDREKEFLGRTRALEVQLRELGEHRRLFCVRHLSVSLRNPSEGLVTCVYSLGCSSRSIRNK